MVKEVAGQRPLTVWGNRLINFVRQVTVLDGDKLPEGELLVMV